MGSKKGLESLKVWQRSVDFAVDINKKILPLLPAEEKWSLTNQLRRASQSVPANIAEGYGRYYYQEGICFCYIARGSLEEVYSQLILADKLEYLESKVSQPIFEEITEIRRMLNGYIKFLRQNKRGEGEPGSNQVISESKLEYYLESDTNTPDS